MPCRRPLHLLRFTRPPAWPPSNSTHLSPYVCACSSSDSNAPHPAAAHDASPLPASTLSFPPPPLSHPRNRPVPHSPHSLTQRPCPALPPPGTVCLWPLAPAPSLLHADCQPCRAGLHGGPAAQALPPGPAAAQRRCGAQAATAVGVGLWVCCCSTCTDVLLPCTDLLLPLHGRAADLHRPHLLLHARTGACVWSRRQPSKEAAPTLQCCVLCSTGLFLCSALGLWQGLWHEDPCGSLLHASSPGSKGRASSPPKPPAALTTRRPSGSGPPAAHAGVRPRQPHHCR